MNTIPMTMASIVVLATVAWSNLLGMDAVQPYPVLGFEPASTFTVTVNETAIPLGADEKKQFGHVARFSMSQPVTVRIRCKGADLARAMLRPQRAGIVTEVVDGALQFRLDRPENLFIRFPDRPDLHLLVYGPLVVPTGDKVYSATDLGVVPAAAPGVAVAIQKALDTVHEQGGGTLVFPDGSYDCANTEIQVKSNVTVFVMPGAQIHGMRFFISNAENVAFAGHGVLDFTGGPGYMKAGALRADNVKNLSIQDVISISRSWNWNTRFDGSHEVTIANYKVFSSKDGIDAVHSSNVRIEHAYVMSGDDNIIIKAMGGGHVVSNIVVENATLQCRKYGGIKIGTETRATSISNVVFRNIEIIDASRPVIIQIRDGADVSNVLFENIMVDYASQAALDFVIGDGRQLRGHIRDVTVRNFIVRRRGERERIRMAGYDDQYMIRNVTFAGFVIEGRPILNLKDIPAVETQFIEGLSFRTLEK